MLIVLSAGPAAMLAAGESVHPNPEADQCAAVPSPERIQVLVELVDTPALGVYRAALEGSTSPDPAQKVAAARAAERAQDQKIKQAQESLSRALARLEARELYRVRRSFNGIAVVVGSDKLAALRSLSGVKTIHPRQRATTISGPSAQAAPAASGAGLKAYIDPATGTLTSTPTEAQVAELERGIGALADESTEGLTAVMNADGSGLVHLEGRFQSFTTATVSPGGAVKVDCSRHGARRPAGSAEGERQ